MTTVGCLTERLYPNRPNKYDAHPVHVKVAQEGAAAAVLTIFHEDGSFLELSLPARSAAILRREISEVLRAMPAAALEAE